MKRAGRLKLFATRARAAFRILGPGLITGAADDDPSGIATYSQTGAQFGFGQLWMSVCRVDRMTCRLKSGHGNSVVHPCSSEGGARGNPKR